MTQAKSKLATFADYLAYDDGLDRPYELTYGELIELPPESDENVLIARAIDRAMADLVGFQRIRTHQLAIDRCRDAVARVPNDENGLQYKIRVPYP